uniref:WGS project CAEQ00000000 data, annotated contig 2285 n=1 Tax=Trypanosoma congolense (strain IL3000) TaxID=1068625 RepID=F9WCW4_TRYCI|nr:unnamed protein product [Trypanosoma congolense IL3000]
MSNISEVHISGVALSHLLSPLTALPSASRKTYALYGHYGIRECDSDTTEKSPLVEAVVRVVAPADAVQPENTQFIGFASLRKSSPHKLSYQDMKLLRDTGPARMAVQGILQPYPAFLLLATVPLETHSTKSTRKVEYSVFGSSSNTSKAAPTYTADKAIPLKVDNMVDSFSPFVRLGDLGIHGYISKDDQVEEQKSPSVSELKFLSSLCRLEEATEEKDNLLKRIHELEKILTNSRDTRM